MKKETPCWSLRLKTDECWDKKEELKNLYNITSCSGVKVEHRFTYMMYRSEEARDVAYRIAKKHLDLFKYIRKENRIAWVDEKYLDPKRR